MALKPPTSGVGRRLMTGVNTLDHEMAEEMAIALGRAGERVADALSAYAGGRLDPGARDALLRQAARAVHAYFIQRELCGLRRHDDAIRHYAIPPEVLARLGAS